MRRAINLSLLQKRKIQHFLKELLFLVVRVTYNEPKEIPFCCSVSLQRHQTIHEWPNCVGAFFSDEVLRNERRMLPNRLRNNDILMSAKAFSTTRRPFGLNVHLIVTKVLADIWVTHCPTAKVLYYHSGNLLLGHLWLIQKDVVTPYLHSISFFKKWPLVNGNTVAYPNFFPPKLLSLSISHTVFLTLNRRKMVKLHPHFILHFSGKKLLSIFLLIKFYHHSVFT